jgi:acyl-CoA synthetase (AMP-forming)/AMP-acid ligase II
MKSGGYKIHPYEIEQALAETNHGAAVAIAAIPSDYWGEVLVAVTENADSSWSARAETALSGLARHKRPRQYISVDELPRNVQGKIVRRQITELLLSHFDFTDGPYPRLDPKLAP